MGAKKLRAFAEVLLLVNELNAEQRADLLDVLRGRPQRASKPKAAKPAAASAKEPKEPKAPKQPRLVEGPICEACGNEEGHTDHFQPSPNYHPFDVKKAKATTP